jgi:hypothetical protein
MEILNANEIEKFWKGIVPLNRNILVRRVTLLLADDYNHDWH